MNKYIIPVILVIFVIIFITLSFLAKTHVYFPLDLTFTLYIQKFHLNGLMVFVSWFGYGYFKFIVLACTAGVLFQRKFFKETAFLLLSSLGAEVFSNLIKIIVARPRPDPELIKQIVHFTANDSFPSGHVLYYVGFFGFILFLNNRIVRNKLVKGFIALTCLFFLILVGPSRIYLGAHWLSDVIGGYLAGLIWLIISILIYNRWKQNAK